jgi:hypothetical protein
MVSAIADRQNLNCIYLSAIITNAPEMESAKVLTARLTIDVILNWTRFAKVRSADCKGIGTQHNDR